MDNSDTATDERHIWYSELYEKFVLEGMAIHSQIRSWNPTLIQQRGEIANTLNREAMTRGLTEETLSRLRKQVLLRIGAL